MKDSIEEVLWKTEKIKKIGEKRLEKNSVRPAVSTSTNNVRGEQRKQKEIIKEMIEENFPEL